MNQKFNNRKIEIALISSSEMMPLLIPVDMNFGGLDKSFRRNQSRKLAKNCVLRTDLELSCAEQITEWIVHRSDVPAGRTLYGDRGVFSNIILNDWLINLPEESKKDILKG